MIPASHCFSLQIPYQLDSTFKDPLNIVFNYIVPYLLLVRPQPA